MKQSPFERQTKDCGGGHGGTVDERKRGRERERERQRYNYVNTVAALNVGPL